MAHLDINQDALATIVAKGILDGLTPQTREQVIVDAIKGVVLTPPKDAYGRPQASPLQGSFERAVQVAMNQIVQERVLAADSQVRADIEKAVDEFITIFPEAWRAEVTQQAVMATVVAHFREGRD